MCEFTIRGQKGRKAFDFPHSHSELNLESAGKFNILFQVTFTQIVCRIKAFSLILAWENFGKKLYIELSFSKVFISF